MIDVVFDDSHKGCLMDVASFIKNIQREQVFEIGFQLDIGDISNAKDAVRKDVINKLWGRFPFEEHELEDFQKGLQKDFDALYVSAQQKEGIRIWTSHTPYELCGLYYTCYLLKHMNCPVQVVELPLVIETKEHSIVTHDSWRSVPPEDHITLISSSKKLTSREVQHYADLWETLMKENAPLRANLNGKLVSVSEDFYDTIIINRIPEDVFHMAFLIGTILVNDLPGCSDSFLALRIEAMIQKGVLNVIKAIKKINA